MSNIVKDYLLRNLEINFPSIFKRAVNFEFNKFLDIIVTLDDGSRVLYNDTYETIRNLPTANSLTEEQCVREFGYRLRTVMANKGVSQSELAERTGMPQSQLSRYINGKNIPSFYKVDRIANALGCSIDDLRVID